MSGYAINTHEQSPLVEDRRVATETTSTPQLNNYTSVGESIGSFTDSAYGHTTTSPIVNEQTLIESQAPATSVRSLNEDFKRCHATQKEKKRRQHRQRYNSLPPGSRDQLAMALAGALKSARGGYPQVRSKPFRIIANSERALAERCASLRRVESKASKLKERRLSDKPDAKIDEADSSSASSDEEELNEILPIEWTPRLKIVLIILALANFCSCVSFSCISPFFPKVATEKGLSPTQTGAIFGIYELVMFVVSPIWGKLMVRIGSKLMFVVGLATTGVTSVLFGFLILVPDGSAFLLLALLIRVFESVAASAFTTASFAISAHMFPGRVTTVIGLLETFGGVGFAAGPPLGGILFEFGGFILPFTILGILLLVAGALSYFMLPNLKDISSMDETGSPRGMIGLMSSPGVMLMLLTTTACAMSLSFYDPTLEPHLSSFDISSMSVGLMFLLSAGTYTLFAPVWGYITNKTEYKAQVMLFASVCSAISVLLIGPSPLLGLEKSLFIIAVGLGLLGFGIGGLFIPTFEMTLDIAKKRGYADSFATYGLVSGMFQSAFSAGGFIGPTLGAFAMEHIGFEWTSTILAFLLFFVSFLLAVHQISTYLISFHRRLLPSNVDKTTADAVDLTTLASKDQLI